MDRRPLLPGAVVVMLAIALAIYLIEKIGQALLAISNVIVLVALAWILTLMLRPAVNWIHGLTLPGRLIRPLRQRWGSRVAERLVHPSYGYSILIVYLLLLAVVSLVWHGRRRVGSLLARRGRKPTDGEPPLFPGEEG